MTTSSAAWRSLIARLGLFPRPASSRPSAQSRPRWSVPSGKTRLVAERVALRPPRLSDWHEWVRLREGSRKFLTPWEPSWTPDALSRPAFRRRLRHQKSGWREDDSYSFLIFERGTDKMVGGVSLSNIRRGVSQAGSLGYWMSQDYAGRGYMTEAVTSIVRFAFGDLRLHRVEAACLIHNEASRAVLGKCGFALEGKAVGYLRINGKWQDHMLFAILADRPMQETRR